MLLVNLAGGPGAGKTTLAYYLTYRLKKAGVRAEFVGEAARELIYNNTPGHPAPPLLDNQVLVTGMQYERYLRLKRHGFQVAVSDSPIVQGMLYCTAAYKYALNSVTRALEDEFEVINIFINRRPGCYDPESRVQRTEAEARAYDSQTRALLGSVDFEVGWGEEEKVAEFILERFL